ncbi:MAG TPA: hypothetical protein PK306_08530 [Aquabacterium sp.]|nr:hypothetical protein [Aquabacterium sp.]HQC95739.1 hypothetical protein [Aquabacterium sp.]
MGANKLSYLLTAHAAFLAHRAVDERDALFEDFCWRLPLLRGSAQGLKNALITLKCQNCVSHAFSPSSNASSVTTLRQSAEEIFGKPSILASLSCAGFVR